MRSLRARVGIWGILFPNRHKLDLLLQGQGSIVRDIDNLTREVRSLQRTLARMERNMADKFDELVAEVESLTTVTEGAVALIDSLRDQLVDAADDPEQIAAIVASLDSSRSKLAAALATNTDADGEEPPVEEEPPVDEPPADEG